VPHLSRPLLGRARSPKRQSAGRHTRQADPPLAHLDAQVHDPHTGEVRRQGGREILRECRFDDSA